MISKSGFYPEIGGGQFINNRSVERTVHCNDVINQPFEEFVQFNDVINQPFEQSVQFNNVINHSIQFNDIIDQPIERSHEVSYNKVFQVPFNLSLLFFTVHKSQCIQHLLRQFILHFNYSKTYLRMSFATVSSRYALSYTADTGFRFNRKEIIKHI
jgi:hypothetical protein